MKQSQCFAILIDCVRTEMRQIRYSQSITDTYRNLNTVIYSSQDAGSLALSTYPGDQQKGTFCQWLLKSNDPWAKVGIIVFFIVTVSLRLSFSNTVPHEPMSFRHSNP